MLGIQLQGLPEMNLENVELENVRMEADYGMVCNDAKNVRIKNLTLITKKTPVVDLKNSRDVVVDGLYTQSTFSPLIQVTGAATGNTVLKNLGLTNSDKQILIGKEVQKNAVQVLK
jgi:hypothetical protein